MIQINVSMKKKNRLKDIENRLMVAKGEERKVGKGWEFGISRGKLLYIGWINNKLLLWSTGNNTQYAVTKHSGKEYIRTHTYITVSLCYIEGINTKL